MGGSIGRMLRVLIVGKKEVLSVDNWSRAIISAGGDCNRAHDGVVGDTLVLPLLDRWSSRGRCPLRSTSHSPLTHDESPGLINGDAGMEQATASLLAAMPAVCGDENVKKVEDEPSTPVRGCTRTSDWAIAGRMVRWRGWSEGMV